MKAPVQKIAGWDGDYAAAVNSFVSVGATSGCAEPVVFAGCCAPVATSDVMIRDQRRRRAHSFVGVASIQKK